MKRKRKKIFLPLLEKKHFYWTDFFEIPIRATTQSIPVIYKKIRPAYASMVISERHDKVTNIHPDRQLKARGTYRILCILSVIIKSFCQLTNWSYCKLYELFGTGTKYESWPFQHNSLRVCIYSVIPAIEHSSARLKAFDVESFLIFALKISISLSL